MFMRRILVSYTSWDLYDIGYYNLSKYASGKVVLILKCRQETLFEFETWLSSGEQRKSGHFPVHQRYCNTFQAWFVRTNWGWPRGDARCRPVVPSWILTGPEEPPWPLWFHSAAHLSHSPLWSPSSCSWCRWPLCNPLKATRSRFTETVWSSVSAQTAPELG